MRQKRFAVLAVSLALTLPAVGVAQNEAIDEQTGLVKAEGWETVAGNCLACHSAKLITQNHGSRNHWKDLIRWMQETQGLWEFEPETEDTILTYLAEHYGPKDATRRMPIPPDLRPPNPYKDQMEDQQAQL